MVPLADNLQGGKSRFLRQQDARLVFAVCPLLLIAVGFLASRRPSQYSEAVGTWVYSPLPPCVSFH